MSFLSYGSCRITEKIFFFSYNQLRISEPKLQPLSLNAYIWRTVLVTPVSHICFLALFGKGMQGQRNQKGSFWSSRPTILCSILCTLCKLFWIILWNKAYHDCILWTLCLVHMNQQMFKCILLGGTSINEFYWVKWWKWKEQLSGIIDHEPKP